LDEEDEAMPRARDSGDGSQYRFSEGGNGGGGDGGPGGERPRRKSQWTVLAIDRELRRKKIDRLIARDELTMADMLLGPLPGWDIGDYPRPWMDEDTTVVAGLLPGVPISLLERVLRLKGSEASYNPLIQCFEALPAWDGVPRVKQFLPRALGLDMTGPLRAYHEAVSERFVWGIVSRGMGQGCKHDSMVILEGNQGIGKSRFCRLLAFADRYFTDSLPPLNGMTIKDAREALMGKSIVEMAELAQFKGSKVEILKTFLSTSTDTVRLPYMARSGIYPRCCVFIGSTNETEYLADVTGNRRFWPLQCGRIDIGYATEVRDQVYAEALVAWREANGKLQLWLPDDIEIIAAEEQAERVEKDPEEDDVIEFVNDLFRYGGPVITSAREYLRDHKHWDEVQLTPSSNPNARAVLMNIARIMRRLGGIKLRSRKQRLYKFHNLIVTDESVKGL
jgi:hypothetical protein